MISLTALRGLFVAGLMKICNKIVETQFTAKDPGFFRLTNDTAEASGHYIQNGTCIFDANPRTDNSQSPVTSWLYTTRYILPVLGGLLSSAWLGYIRVLQIGGVIMLLSTVLMSVSVYLGLMCQPSPMIPITWLLLPLFFGLTQPNIVHGMLQWHRQRRLSTIVSAFYYFISVLGEWIALQMAPLSEVNALGSNSTLIFMALSALFVSLSFLLPRDSNEEPFQMPTLSRRIRYFQIFSGLILFLVSVADTRSAMYVMEMNFYLNGTAHNEENSWLSPKGLNLVTMMITSLILMSIAAINPYQLPVQPRMQSGILLESAVAVCLMIVTIAGVHSTTTVVAVYSVASIADAIAEVLIMVAAYDLVQNMAPRNSKTFVFGIMFTVWGIANFASRFLISIMRNWLQPTADEKPHFYLYHLIALVALIACSIYHRFLSLPLALKVTPTDDDNSGPEGDEIRPLLSMASSEI